MTQKGGFAPTQETQSTEYAETGKGQKAPSLFV
jgi:hypothetical protein